MVTKDGISVEEYSYDLSGTRVSETNTLRGFAARKFSYSDEDHLLTAGSVTYAYDPDGFLTTKTDGVDVTAYSYSSGGELLKVTLSDGAVVEYVHDPLGRRIAKKVDGVITEKYLWQSMTRLLAVYDGADNLLMRFEYADDRTPVAMTTEGDIYYLGYDQVGSLRVVADYSANMVKRIDYDSFGNIIVDTNEAFKIPFGFAGGLYDRDAGLVRFGFRDYNPDAGRWTAKDPILFAGGDTDLYGYVLNNPVSFIDPNGEWLVGAVIGGIAGAAGGINSALINGGSLGAAIWGGVTGAIAGAFVGGVLPDFVGIPASSAAGAMVGSVVGGAVGGATGAVVSSWYATGNISGNTVLTGAATGAFSGAIAAPGIGLASIETGGSEAGMAIMGATGSIMGDTIGAAGLKMWQEQGTPCGK